MKLKTKLAISYLLLVLIVVSFGLVFMNIKTNMAFQDFVKKRMEIEIHFGDFDDYIHEQRKFLMNSNKLPAKAPERIFIETINDSFFIAMLFGLSIALLLAYIAAKFFANRIENLKTIMNEYEKTGKAININTKNQDEIYELEKAYNSLINKIDKQEKIRKQFFTDLSHELQTPITAIYGYLQGLKDGVFEPSKEFINKPISEIERMQDMLKEMTTLAKLESSEIKIDKKKINLKEISQDIVESFHDKLKAKGLKINVKGDLQINADSQKFKQVIINLIKNAIDYTDQKTTIKIMMGIEEKIPFWSIENKASKFDEKNIEFLFDRFFRADLARSHSEMTNNLGIGLNIVKNIVESHGFSIKAEYNKPVFAIKIFFE